MSCGQPGPDEMDSERIPILPPPSSVCVRCKQPPKIVVRNTAWCHDCFLTSFTGRFRRSLEGAKAVSRSGFEAYAAVEASKEGGRKGKGGEKEELSKVLFAFSGGSSSRAMLELFKTSYYKQDIDGEPETASLAKDDQDAEMAAGKLHEGETQEISASEKAKVKKEKKKIKGQKRLPRAFGECIVVYVDLSELPGFGGDKTSEVRQVVETTTPFRFVSLKLSSLFSSSTSPLLSTSLASQSLPSHIHSSAVPSNASPTAKLLSLLHPSPPLSPTTYSSLLQTLVHSLLVKAAREEQDCRVLMMGDNSTRLGIKMVSSMSQGRGWSVGEEIGMEYVDRGDEGEDKNLLVVRPMGGLLSKEIAYYTTSEGLESVTVPNEDTSISIGGGSRGANKGEGKKDIKKMSIGTLVEDFVLSLEAEFPSTVSIITKTAHKLGLRSADAAVTSQGKEGVNACALCGLPAQREAAEWRNSITISDLQAARNALASTSNGNDSTDDVKAAKKTTVESRAKEYKERRTPYQPSQAHLIDPSSTSGTTGTAEANGTSSTVAKGDLLAKEAGREEQKEDRGEETIVSLSRHLCYGCLLMLQTARPNTSTPSKPSLPSTVTSRNLDDQGNLEDGQVWLPSYVADAVRRKEASRMDREEGMRKEIEEYLL